MAHTGMSVKNRDRASDKVKEKLKLCGMFFGKMEMRFLVLSSFSHCKLKCQGYVFYSVHQFYNVFIKAREVKWHLASSIFCSMQCIWIWKQKISLIWATDFSPTLFCFSIKTFSKFWPDCFSCSCLEKKRTTYNTICHLTSNQHNPPMRNVTRSWPVPRIM